VIFRTDTDRSAIYDFLLVIHSSHWPISYTVFEINGDSIENRSFPVPCIEVVWNFVPPLDLATRLMLLPDGGKRYTVKLRIEAGPRIDAGPRIQAGGLIHLYR